MTPVGLAARPHELGFREASSVPRNGPFRHQRKSMHEDSDVDPDDDAAQDTPTDALPTRGAIDIVKGLEKKRQRRREKLFEKHCRLKGKSRDKKHFVLPGKGAERMREMGMELAALRGGIRKPGQSSQQMEQGQHILSY